MSEITSQGVCLIPDPTHSRPSHGQLQFEKYFNILFFLSVWKRNILGLAIQGKTALKKQEHFFLWVYTKILSITLSLGKY